MSFTVISPAIHTTHIHTHTHTYRPTHAICFNADQSKNIRHQQVESATAAGSICKNNSEVNINKLSALRLRNSSTQHAWGGAGSRIGLAGGLFGGAANGHGGAATTAAAGSALLPMPAEAKLTFKRDRNAKTHSGSCKWYNSQRGFGFIIPDDLSLNFGDVFVHHTVILSKGFRSLNAGERLEFTVRGSERMIVFSPALTACLILHNQTKRLTNIYVYNDGRSFKRMGSGMPPA